MACKDDDLQQDPNTGWWTCDMKPVREVVRFRWKKGRYEAP
jgi:hypothetical protein